MSEAEVRKMKVLMDAAMKKRSQGTVHDNAIEELLRFLELYHQPIMSALAFAAR